MNFNLLKAVKLLFSTDEEKKLVWIEESIQNKKENYEKESDEEYNIRKCKELLGYTPNFKNPKTFTENLLCLKMYYDNPLQNTCADKFTVMDYVRKCGYESILKEIYQVCDRVEDIKWDKLPDRFFIQCSHTQGNNFIVDKNDKKQIRYIKKLYNIILPFEHYLVHRENCYKGIQTKIICGELLDEEGQTGLTDYKFYCFAGKPMYFMVSYGELEHNVKNHKFDMDWNSIDYLFKENEAIEASSIKRPRNFEKMVEIVTTLSKPFPHVRVDLYNINGRIVFGEMTFYSSGGFVKVLDKEMDEKIGSWIPLEKFLQLDGDNNE